MHSIEENTKKMLYSGVKDTKLSNQVEKMKKIEKNFFDIFAPPRGTPPLPHISTLGQLIKNRLDGPTIRPKMSVHAKFQVCMMIRLGCRGG